MSGYADAGYWDVGYAEFDPVDPANATHAHTATSPALTPSAIATVANGGHAHTATSPALTPHAVTTVANGGHVHTATSPTLSARSSATIGTATHSHAATSPTLTPHAVTTVANAAHAHTATTPALAAGSVSPTGFIAQPLLPLPQTGLADGLPQHHAAHPARSLVKPADLVAGTTTDVQPISIRSNARTGSLARSYFDDYYNRIHITPMLIDLGSVATGTDRVTTIWNAYLSNSTLNAMPAAEDGVVPSGITTPHTMKPLARKTVTIHVNADGPATIDARFTFNFSTGDAVSLTVTGTRARLWPFRPNWRDGVEVSPAYRTDIITSRSGREQRRALRSTHRRSISYTITVEGGERQRLTQLLSTWQGRSMLLGDPTRKVALVDGSPAHAGLAAVASVPEWLVEGRQIVIGDDLLAAVTGIDETLVTFAPANLQPLAAGTTLRPALTGQLTGQMGASHPVNRVAEAKISFAVEPGSEPAEPGEPSLYIHGGREVFTHRPNWSEGVDQAFDWPVEQVDFGHGRVRTFQPVTAGWFTQSAVFLGVNPQVIADIESFFHRMRGRRGEFFMATGTEDFTIRDTAVAGTAYLRVAGTDIYDNYSSDTRYRAIMLRTNDGRTLMRSIGSMYLVSDALGDDTVLELTQEWFFDIDPQDIATTSWLSVFRFASDDATFEWITDEVAQTKMAMRSLENLPAEAPLAGLDDAARWLLESWGESGMTPFDDIQWLVNVRYSAIWWWPLPWVMVNETVVDSFDLLVNQEYPEIFD